MELNELVRDQKDLVYVVERVKDKIDELEETAEQYEKAKQYIDYLEEVLDDMNIEYSQEIFE